MERSNVDIVCLFVFSGIRHGLSRGANDVCWDKHRIELSVSTKPVRSLYSKAFDNSVSSGTSSIPSSIPSWSRADVAVTVSAVCSGRQRLFWWPCWASPMVLPPVLSSVPALLLLLLIMMISALFLPRWLL